MSRARTWLIIEFAALAATILSSCFLSRPAAAQNPPAPPAAKPGDERSRLLGTWKCVFAERDGMPDPAWYEIGFYIHFTEKEAMEWSEGSGSAKYFDLWSVEPQVRPGRLNLFEENLFDEQGREYVGAYPGIYQWDGKKLKVAVPYQAVPSTNKQAVDERRPAALSTTPQTRTYMVHVFEKVPDVRPPPRS